MTVSTSSLRAPSRLSVHSRAPSVEGDALQQSAVRASLGGLRFVEGGDEGAARFSGRVTGSERSSAMDRDPSTSALDSISFGGRVDGANVGGRGAVETSDTLLTQDVSFEGARGATSEVLEGWDGRDEVRVGRVSRSDGSGRVGAAREDGSRVLLTNSLRGEVKLLRGLQKDLEKEKAELSARHAESLQLLEEKDAVIDRLSDEHADITAQLAQCKTNLNHSQSQVAELLEVGEGLRGELQRVQDEYDAAMASWEERVVDQEAELVKEREVREELETNMNEVAEAMDAAEEIMVEMEARVEGLEKKCQRLVRFVEGRLGVDAERVIRAGGFGLNEVEEDEQNDADDDGHGDKDGEVDEGSDSPYPTSHAVLLKANKALEEALIQHAVPANKVDVLVGERIERVALPGYESREHEEIARLKEQLDIAQQVALQSEAELMLLKKEARHGADSDGCDEDGGEDGRAEDEQLKKEAEKWRDDALEKIVDLEEALETSRAKLDAYETKNMELESLLETAMGNKDAIEADLSRSQKGAKEIFVRMQKEIQGLRADLFATQRNLSSKEAKIASLQATQQFSLDISDWDSLDMDSIDPSSSPIEFLVRSLQEAAQMQAELLESLSEHAFERVQGREALAAVERDMERVLGVLDTMGGPEARYGYEASLEEGAPSSFVERLGAIERDEAETLRAQVEKSVAIQQGQAEAFSLLAKKTRQKEADLKTKMQGYEAVLRSHESFFADLETAVPALRAALAKVALVEEGEDAAAAILAGGVTSSDQGHGDILDLSIAVSEKLSNIAQALCDGTIAMDRGAAKGYTRRDEQSDVHARLREVEALYEAAKAEARQANVALQELKQGLPARSDVMSPASVGMINRGTPEMAATSGAILGDDLIGFVTRFEELLDESGRLEDRVRTLEDENARLIAAVNDTSQQNVQTLREELANAKSEIVVLQNANRQQLVHIEALRHELDGTHASLESAIRKQTLQSDRHVEDLTQLKEIYEGQLSQLKVAAETDRTHLMSMVDKAAGETCELHETLADAEQNLERLKKRLNDVEAEKKSLEHERKSFLKGHVRRTHAINAAAAIEQAKAERLKRQSLEKKLAETTKHCNGLYEDDNSVDGDDLNMDDETLAARLSEAQMRINDLERRLETTGENLGENGIKAEWGTVDRDLDNLENDVVNMMTV